MDRFVDLILRPARLAEAPGLAAMSRDLIETGLDWRYRPAQLAAMVRDPDTVVLVARGADSQARGFAAMAFSQETAHLTLLCVQPAHRCRGIATRLVEWLTESARVAGVASIHLELRADNAAALALYRRLAFAERQMVADYYGPGIAARRMARALRPTPDVAAG